MKYPAWLKGHIKDWAEKGLTTMTLCSSAGNELLEVWYFGELWTIPGEPQPYIGNTDFAPSKIMAKDPATGEMFLVFDGAQHGYDNMFCDSYTPEQLANRPLKQYFIPASSLVLELGYSIDYEDEKEDYDFDEEGQVIFIDNRRMAWEDVKRNGFDYLALSYRDEGGQLVQFVDCELA